MADMNYVSPLTSDLTDYYTKSEVDELQQSDAATYATSAEIVAGDNAVKGWVVSQGFLTEHQDLTNYATIKYVDDAIAAIEPSSGGMAVRVVNTLPSVGEENVLYLVFVNNDDEDNRYAEYVWVDTLNDYEMLGFNSSEGGIIPDLTDYATKQWVEAKGYLTAVAARDVAYDNTTSGLLADTVQNAINEVNDKVEAIDVPAAPDLSPYATKAELSAKANSADLAAVATTGSYNDLTDKPSIPSTSGLASESYVDNAVAAITVPTKTSDLTNDSGFITSADLPDTSGFVESSDLATVATSGSYTDLTDKPTIPAAPDLTPYATKQELTAKADAASLASVATSGSYNDLSDKPVIPSEGLSQVLGDNFFKLFAFQSGQSIQTTAYVEVSNSSQVSDAIKKGLIFIPTVSQIAINYPDFTTENFVEIYVYYNGDFDSRVVKSPYVWSGMAYVRVGDNTLLGWNIDTSKINKVEKLRTSILKAFTKYQPYINTTSGLTATTVQGAIDELAAASGGGASTAAQLSYDNTNTWNNGTDTDTVQEAIDSLYADVDGAVRDVDGVSQRVDGVEKSIADLPPGYELSDTYDANTKTLTLSVIASSDMQEDEKCQQEL